MTMMTASEKTITTLNDLIDACKDGQQGYETAAKDAKAPELAQLFRQFSRQRADFVGELQNRIRSLDGDPDKTGSLTGSLHRGWINLKSAVASNEPRVVLEECARGEEAAVKAYREALEGDLDMATRDIVSRQNRAILAAFDRIKQLRDSSAYQGSG